MHLLTTLLLLSVIIIVHEFGHYLAARWAGVQVKEFALGFGPTLLSYQGKQTRWSVRLLLFGGWVEMKGMHTDELEDDPDAPDAFLNVHPFKRMIILLAGVSANVIGAIGLLAIALGIGWRIDTTPFLERLPELEKIGTITDPKVLVSQVIVDSHAHQEGILPGDLLVSVDGQPCFSINEVQELIATDEPHTFVFQRGEDSFAVILEKEKLSLTQDQRFQFNVLWTVPTATIMTITTIGLITISLPKIIASFFEPSSKNPVGGPVQAVHMGIQEAKKSVAELLFYGWMMSLSVIFFNLFPIPGLDGGHAALLLPELFTRHKVSEQNKLFITSVCILGLMILTFVVTIKDIIVLLN